MRGFYRGLMKLEGYEITKKFEEVKSEPIPKERKSYETIKKKRYHFRAQ